MSLTDKITESIKDAMRNKEKQRLEALRAIKSALLLESTKGGGATVDEKVELQILTRLQKQRKESATIYKEQGRDDLASEEDFQAEVIEEFLPAQLTDAEVDSIIDEIIAQTGANDMKDMGKVMGQATAKMAGKADAKLIADKVKEKLSQ